MSVYINTAAVYGIIVPRSCYTRTKNKLDNNAQSLAWKERLNGYKRQHYLCVHMQSQRTDVKMPDTVT